MAFNLNIANQIKCQVYLTFGEPFQFKCCFFRIWLFKSSIHVNFIYHFEMYSRRKKIFFSASKDETVIMNVFAIFYVVGFINCIDTRFGHTCLFKPLIDGISKCALWAMGTLLAEWSSICTRTNPILIHSSMDLSICMFRETAGKMLSSRFGIWPWNFHYFQG